MRRPRQLALQQAAAAVGQGLLVARYAEAFGRHGLGVGQVLLTVDDMTRRTHYRNAYSTLHKLLDLGVSTGGILAILYSITAVLGASTILWVLNSADVYFLWVIFAWVVAVAFFLVLDRLNRRRRALENQE